MAKKNILFVYSNYSSFVAQDHEILSSVYEVQTYRFKAIKGLAGTGVEILKQFFFLAVNIWKNQGVFVWFADYHSILPVLFARLLNKKSFVVVGGYDVSYLPEYNYGSFNRPIRKFCAKTSLCYASICFPVAEVLGEKSKIICSRVNIEVLPTTTDHRRFNFTSYDRNKSVITVATTNSYQRSMIKGLDRFRELAVALPYYEFTIIGVDETFKEFFDPVPENLKLIPPVAYNELPQYYQRSSFYAQLSRSEGLPNSLCEAMLCGCIPVGTDVGDIRLAIEGIGLVMKECEIDEAAKFINMNHNSGILRDQSRRRIIEKYDPVLRINRLRNLI